MRYATYKTLERLYQNQEVSANTNLQCSTTRITNEISALRNTFKVDIVTQRKLLENKKWYGSYKLVKTEKNLKRVRAILEECSNLYEAKSCKN
jgi:hypothetical protein